MHTKGLWKDLSSLNCANIHCYRCELGGVALQPASMDSAGLRPAAAALAWDPGKGMFCTSGAISKSSKGPLAALHWTRWAQRSGHPDGREGCAMLCAGTGWARINNYMQAYSLWFVGVLPVTFQSSSNCPELSSLLYMPVLSVNGFHL